MSSPESPKISLAFKFANHDNSVSPVSFEGLSLDLTVKQVKLALFDAWPSTLRKPSGPSYILLICMGRPLEDDKSLRAAHLPIFEWMTPVHVTIRGGVVRSSGAAADAAEKSPPVAPFGAGDARGGAAAGGGSSASSGGAGPSGGGAGAAGSAGQAPICSCCTIS